MSKNEAPVGARSADEQWLDILADEVARLVGADSDHARTDGSDPWVYITDTVRALMAKRNEYRHESVLAKVKLGTVSAELAEARRDAAAARAERDTALGLRKRLGYREVDTQVVDIIDNMSNALAHTGRAIEAAAEALAAMNGGNRES